MQVLQEQKTCPKNVPYGHPPYSLYAPQTHLSSAKTKKYPRVDRAILHNFF